MAISINFGAVLGVEYFVLEFPVDSKFRAPYYPSQLTPSH